MADDSKKPETEEERKHREMMEELFGDIDEESETPEEIRAERDQLRTDMAALQARIRDVEKEAADLKRKLEARKAATMEAEAAIHREADVAGAAKVAAFVKDALPVAEELGREIAAIAPATRADKNFDALVQGMEKTLVQLTEAFNQVSAPFAAETNAPQTPENKTAETTAPIPPEKPAAETPEAILAERDTLRAGKLVASTRLNDIKLDIFKTLKLIEAHKTEELETLSRVRAQAEARAAFALEKPFKIIMPALDTLDHGLEAIRRNAGRADALPETKKLAVDVEKTINGLATVFNKYGITVINPLNQPFDEKQHYAISVQGDEDGETMTVVAVARKGYDLNKRNLRPAQVVVLKQ